MMLRRRRKQKQKARKRRKFWVRDIFAKLEMHGKYHHLLPDLLSGEREFYFRYLRMNPEQLEHLLSLVKDKTSKKYKIWNKYSVNNTIFDYRNIGTKLKFWF